jgi:hypothetical protein
MGFAGAAEINRAAPGERNNVARAARSHDLLAEAPISVVRPIRLSLADRRIDDGRAELRGRLDIDFLGEDLDRFAARQIVSLHAAAKIGEIALDVRLHQLHHDRGEAHAVFFRALAAFDDNSFYVRIHSVLPFMTMWVGVDVRRQSTGTVWRQRFSTMPFKTRSRTALSSDVK